MLDKKIYNEIAIVHLIYAKYRNQQRLQKWWIPFSIVHRKLVRLVQANAVDANSADLIANKLIPRAAKAFHSILKQGAFITLGFALIAAVARLRTLLLPYVKSKPRKVVKPALSLHPQEDLGEVIDLEPKQVKKPKDKTKTKDKLKDKKQKKKSKKQSIDDIFG